MNESKSSRTRLGIVLNAADALVALFAIFAGRLIISERSSAVGYAFIAFGILLAYLSFGLWSTDKWKIIVRMLLYAAAFCLLFGAIIYSVLAKHQGLSEQFPLPLVSACLFVIVVLSGFHLRIWMREQKMTSQVH